MTSLRQRSIAGMAWTFSQQFSVQLVGFFISIVLARILMPEEFGLVGMIAVIIALGDSLKDAGMTQSLIRTNQPTDEDYSTVFYVNLLISLVLYAIIFLIAPFVAEFYEEPVLINMLRLLSLSIVISAFSAVQQTKLTKEMNFRTQFIINLPSSVIGGLVGVAMAYNAYGVWSIIAMQLTKSLLSAIQLWIYSQWIPKRIFSMERLKWHFKFGYRMTLSGLIDTLYENLYYIIIGKYFSAAVLGFYSRANTTKQLPVQNISAALNKVSYPMFAEIKDDNERLKIAFRILMQQVLFWVVPMLIGAAVVAEPLFRLVFTEKWLPAVPMFQLLCVAGIMYPLNAYNLGILKVKGRSDLHLKLELVKKSYIIVGVLLIVPFGLYALLWFQIFVAFSALLINTYYSGKLISYSLLEQLKNIAPIFVVGIVMGVACYFADRTLIVWEASDLTRLLVAAIVGIGFYFSISIILNLAPYREFLKTIKRNK